MRVGVKTDARARDEGPKPRATQAGSYADAMSGELLRVLIRRL
jgi:hypothetical protein